MSTRAEGYGRAVAFVALSAALIAALVVSIGQFRFDESSTYHAIVRNTSGLNDGDPVRAAGVTVGAVQGVEIQPDNTARVTFTAASRIPLTTATLATIRYKNLTGDMYLDLTQGKPGARTLPEDGVLPVEQTRPALDLDELFNGFKPLLQGLEPEQVNRLSSSIIGVFQGQSASVNGLLDNIATFTGTLADQDQVIGELIDNLNSVLGTLDNRRGQVSELVSNLRKVVQGLARDRNRLGGSLTRLTQLAEAGSEFIELLRPELRGTVRQTHRLAKAMNSDLALVDKHLSDIPEALDLIGRVGAYGSFYNLYACVITVTVSGPNGPVTSPTFQDTSPRCADERGGR